MRPTIIAIAGFSSEVGKTTLLCNLLKRHPGWEAVKMTRGHYRSCGKDPHACCVSPLLGNQPLVFSGREGTDRPGKDTGRYWESGAGNVHWVVGTDDQIAKGSKIALDRISAAGVFVEGTSFLKYVQTDYSIMVATPGGKDVKSSAAGVMSTIDALFISGVGTVDGSNALSALWRKLALRGISPREIPAYFDDNLDELDRRIVEVHSSFTSRNWREGSNSQSVPGSVDPPR
jgi:molybdopterin-guanine dinucleotide biosynthesis protein